MSELTFALAALFASVALVMWAGLNAVLAPRTPGRERLDRFVARPLAAIGVLTPRLVEAPSPVAVRVAAYVPKSPESMSRLQRRMARAGFHGLAPAVVVSVAEIALAAAAALAVLWVAGAPRGLLFAPLGAILGYMLPGFVVSRRIMLRQTQIENGLPDALDLLTVCLEAGLALDGAILKTAEELEIAYPALANELRMVTVETRAGKSRVEALKNFAARTKVDDVRGLVVMLVQTERFGTSVAQALRTFADVSRTKRRQRAEERAAKVGVKLVFPLVLCLFPAFYVVTLGPAIIQFVRVFFGHVAGR